MKRNLLLLTFTVICSSFVFSMPSDTRKQIKMKVRQKIEHRSTIQPTQVRASISNSTLEIEFEHPTKEVTISITNTTTGETVYYERSTAFEKIKSIDLCEKDNNTEYTLAISTAFWSTTGVFKID